MIVFTVIWLLFYTEIMSETMSETISETMSETMLNTVLAYCIFEFIFQVLCYQYKRDVCYLILPCQYILNATTIFFFLN